MLCVLDVLTSGLLLSLGVLLLALVGTFPTGLEITFRNGEFDRREIRLDMQRE
jgi:hypothetical protein